VVWQMKIDRHIYAHVDLKWDGLQLRLRSGRLLAAVEPDRTWPGMYRVRLPGGHLTDMVNLSRAKDAAISLVLTELNNWRRDIGRADGGSVRQDVEGVPPRQLTNPARFKRLPKGFAAGVGGVCIHKRIAQPRRHILDGDMRRLHGSEAYE
jgi:hypothetical protein